MAQDFDSQDFLLSDTQDYHPKQINMTRSIVKNQEETKTREGPLDSKLVDMSQYSQIHYKELTHLSQNTLNFTIKDHEESRLKSSIMQLQGKIEVKDITQLKKATKKWKAKCENLNIQNKQLQKRLEKHEKNQLQSIKGSRMKTSVKQIKQEQKKKCILFEKQISHQLSLHNIHILELRQYFQRYRHLFNDTKTILIVEESLKLAEVFQLVKLEISDLQQNLILICEDRNRLAQQIQSLGLRHQVQYNQLLKQYRNYKQQSIQIMQRLKQTIERQRQSQDDEDPSYRFPITRTIQVPPFLDKNNCQQNLITLRKGRNAKFKANQQIILEFILALLNSQTSDKPIFTNQKIDLLLDRVFDQIVDLKGTTTNRYQPSIVLEALFSNIKEFFDALEQVKEGFEKSTFLIIKNSQIKIIPTTPLPKQHLEYADSDIEHQQLLQSDRQRLNKKMQEQSILPSQKTNQLFSWFIDESQQYLTVPPNHQIQ